MVGSRLSPEVKEVKVIPSIIPLLRLARGLMLLLASLVCYLIYIWYKAQSSPWVDDTFGIFAFPAIFISFTFGSYELYYGVKFIRIPTSNLLSFESNVILVMSLISEMMVIMFYLISPLMYSTPQLKVVLVLINFSLYLSFFLLEVRILYSMYSSRPKRVPEFNDSYIPERYK
jgi:hypothetical protein